MCLLFETIACINGNLQNLKWHNVRFNASRERVFNAPIPLYLDTIKVPAFAYSGIWKCRVLYNKTITGVSFEPYIRREINTLALIETDISYDFKRQNRDELELLYKQKQHADDIIIIKNNEVTDASIYNIVLYNGHDWLTPNTPLLKGTMRDQLLEKGRIKTTQILRENLVDYQKIMLINALNPFDESKVINISNVLNIENT